MQISGVGTCLWFVVYSFYCQLREEGSPSAGRAWVSTCCGQSLELGSKFIAVLGMIGGVVGSLILWSPAFFGYVSGILHIAAGGLLLWGTL